MEITYDAVAGLQFGDEGKGKIVQTLSESGNYDLVARFSGGPNAGHTMYYKETKVVTHVVPSGVLAGLPGFIGPGCVIDPVLLREEIEILLKLGLSVDLYVSELAHVITPYERLIDLRMNKKLGTTGRGIGPTYANTSQRIGLRVKDVFHEECQITLSDFWRELAETYRQDWINVEQEEERSWSEAIIWLMQHVKVAKREFFLSSGQAKNVFGKTNGTLRILAEGAQAVMLDPFYGTYPYVTSSHCVPSYIPIGLGLPGNAVKGEVYGVFKAYLTRVGAGPFLTEMEGDSSFGGDGERIRIAGQEFGSTTNRPRRVGWLDLVDLFDAIDLCGVTKLVITKSDILKPENISGKVYVCYEHGYKTAFSKVAIYKKFEPWRQLEKVAYGENGKVTHFGKFIAFVEKELGRKIDMISTGPNVEDLIYPHKVKV